MPRFFLFVFLSLSSLAWAESIEFSFVDHRSYQVLVEFDFVKGEGRLMLPYRTGRQRIRAIRDAGQGRYEIDNDEYTDIYLVYDLQRKAYDINYRYYKGKFEAPVTFQTFNCSQLVAPGTSGANSLGPVVPSGRPSVDRRPSQEEIDRIWEAVVDSSRP